MIRWSIDNAIGGTRRLDELLDDGWEPFGVIMYNGAVKVYLRKSTGMAIKCSE